METIIAQLCQFLGVWLFSVMVFFMNPLNDPTKPGSRMNYYHPDNVMVREEARINYGGRAVAEWRDIAPCVISAIVTVIGWVGVRILALFFVSV